MNKELFVSSTPHETKVGMVEDDLLAEIYLERENEYTLAGSIYKGRVTRVLPGMQSAFVDIGLERDAFLYVSDFMELEEHDEDLTDEVPANRGVQDLRQQPSRGESPSADEAVAAQETEAADATGFENGSAQDFEEAEQPVRYATLRAAAAGHCQWWSTLRTVSVEDGADDAAVVADAAMGGATGGENVIELSRALPGLQPSQSLLSSCTSTPGTEQKPAVWPARRDTSRLFCLENRFPNTAVWRSRPVTPEQPVTG